jgi:uncharacterized protein YukE
MTDEHFAIDPAPVSSLADDFTASASFLDGRITEFAARAEKVDDAFGVLAESTEALAKYVEMTQSTVTALRELSAGLATYAEGLRQNVAAYQESDTAQAQRFGGK